MFKGILLSVLASVTFGVLYFYTQFLGMFDSEQTFGWRILATLPFLTLFMYFTGELNNIAVIFRRLCDKPILLLGLLLTSALSSLQLWLFLWGPIHGRGLQVSLGYFLLPMVLVLFGCIFFKEKLSKFQLLSVILAALGVGSALWRQGGIAWETIVVAVGYSLYFLLRKKLRTDHLGGFWWDLLLCLPVAIYFIDTQPHVWSQMVSEPILLLIVLGLGLFSSIGLGSYILASRYLPLILFGLLSYLEPVLLALVSILLGESIEASEWWTYIAIWAAVLVLVFEGAWHIYVQRRQAYRLKKQLKAVEHLKK